MWTTRSSRTSRHGLTRWLGELAELLDAADRVARLNRMLVGWATYFRLGPVSKAYRAVDDHARYRLRQWLCAKHKVKGQGTSRFPDEYLDRTLGLVKLQSRPRNFPRANA